jgi:NADH:ubiquinone oxidoreductase subunit D
MSAMEAVVAALVDILIPVYVSLVFRRREYILQTREAISGCRLAHVLIGGGGVRKKEGTSG